MSVRPRILHVTENLDNSFGGPPRSVPYLAKYLIDLGTENHLFSIKLFEHESNEIIEKNRIRWSSAPYAISRASRYAPGLRRLVTAELGDRANVLLHSHNMWNYAPFLVYQLHRKFGVPFIMSVRGSLFDWSLRQSKRKKTVALRIFQRQMLNRANLIHAATPGERNAIRKLGITTPVAVIPNGVAIDEFAPDLSKSDACATLGLDPEKRHMLFLSRIAKEKGLDQLIEIWMSLASRFQDWHLMIVGPMDKSPYAQKIKLAIQKASADGIATYLGTLSGSQRRAAYSVAELFVLPTHTESFGNVVVEALASSTPVITTKGAPWSELPEYQAGWWIDSNVLLKSSLELALALPTETLAKMGGNGLRLVKQNYRWEVVANKMKSAYEWVLNGGRGSLPFID